MDWKNIDPEHRMLLIEMLSRDATRYLANAEVTKTPDGREYYRNTGRAYSAAAEALRRLAEGDHG